MTSELQYVPYPRLRHNDGVDVDVPAARPPLGTISLPTLHPSCLYWDGEQGGAGGEHQGGGEQEGVQEARVPS